MLNSLKNTKDGKPFYKKWWFWLIIAIVVIIGATGNSESNSSTKNKSETKTVAKKESVAAKKERLKKEAEEKAEADRKQPLKPLPKKLHKMQLTKTLTHTNHYHMTKWPETEIITKVKNYK